MVGSQRDRAVVDAGRAHERDPGSIRTATTPIDLRSASRGFVSGVRALPGVVQVFPHSSGVSRWFDGPVTEFSENGTAVWAWVTIGVDRHHPVAGTTGLVRAYLRARLVECGFERIAVHVQVAVLR